LSHFELFLLGFRRLVGKMQYALLVLKFIKFFANGIKRTQRQYYKN